MTIVMRSLASVRGGDDPRLIRGDKLLNNGGLISDNATRLRLRLLNDPPGQRMFLGMRRMIQIIGLALGLALLAGGPGLAACFADYKAKMDDPLRLHYGVIELPDNACSVPAAFVVIAPRVAAGGWELLEVMSVFDESGLSSRRGDAGQFYLRF